MSKTRRTSVMLALAGILTSLVAIVSPGTAAAAESVPTLQWPVVEVGPRNAPVLGSPTGSITVPCASSYAGRDLVTYSATGQIVRSLVRTVMVDGVENCISKLVVDKNDVLYGIPYGKNSSGSYVQGPNLLAYTGNTLKWKYPLSCANRMPSVVVGADGNIYATSRTSDGVVHLIGIRPELISGQTQPDKVLDVVIPSDCSIELFAYKDGIMLHGQSSSGAQFYSYGGKKVGAAAGSIWDERLNAEGQLFYQSYVAGPNYTSTRVNMFDPRTGQVTWTTTASAPNADTNGVSLAPLPGGGLVALLTEQAMDAYGMPVVPKTWVKKLVTLSSAGQILQAVILPTMDAGGNTFGNTFLAAESGGKVVVIREMFVKTQVSSPSTVPAIAIGVYNPYGGDWGYQTVMSGDLSKTGGPSGYVFEYADSVKAMAITNGTLSFLAKCTNNCTNYNAKLYAVSVSGLGMDYPRGAVLNRSPRPSSAYVALGDSYSSGEGVEPFDSNTALPGVNTCHRSQYSYARTIAGSSPKIPSLGSNGFRACSGAVTDNVFDVPQWNEGAQVDLWRDPGTQLVTITIGGNDMGFADFGRACFWSSCDTGTAAYNTAVNNINNVLPARLDLVYMRLLDMYPNAKIYVLGYPQVVANKSTTSPDDARCVYMQKGNTKYGNARAARTVVDLLNGKILQRVNAVRALGASNTRLRFIDVAGPTSPFNGHEVCGTSTTSWFQNVDQTINDPAYALHPNLFGYDGYATIAATEINAG